MHHPYVLRVARLSSVLALLACNGGTGAKDTDEDSDGVTGPLGLLEQCATPTDFEPQPEHFSEGKFLGLRVMQDCVRVDEGAECPDVTQPLPWAQSLGNFCATSETVCVVSFTSRSGTVRDTGFDSDPEDSDAPDPSDLYDRCCYEYIGVVPDYVCGRPWRIDDQITTAPIVPGHGWGQPLADAEPAHREAVLARWVEDAATEHASIAAFAGLTLDLLAHGFPAELVAGAARAQADEIRHAEGALAIASSVAGAPLAPGALPVVWRASSLVELAVEAAVDGGLGESLAAAVAAARLAVATDAHVRAHLSAVVRDEAEHAALAWRLVDHAVAIGGEEVRQAVEDALEEALGRLLATELPPEPMVASHGLCGAPALVRARDAVVREVFGWAVAA